ncbi:MAG: hypothetical protein BWZ10_03049 [candidate division BRC1 bacterium ADurb.BinA364]|nr:MAG: hypothetical protein BWZ10_03049 [candidate division BRC1 bacterium ADurb.BinA364]
MKRKTSTAIAAAIALAIGLAAGGCGAGQGDGAAKTPSERVRLMSQSARLGQTDAYLACFDGDLKTELAHARDQAGEEAFADMLRRRAAPVRGMAISDQTDAGDSMVRLKVEWVFEDRNEIQAIGLRQSNGDWKIVQMDEAQYRKPAIPYGTEAY